MKEVEEGLLEKRHRRPIHPIEIVPTRTTFQITKITNHIIREAKACL
jgi:hypothetical protein